MLQGAGGMIVWPAEFLSGVRRLCDRHGVLMIADEVLTGFGRTGRMFASELYGIEPDMLVVSKQITSSYLPLSAILLNDKIYQAIADNSAKVGTFGHGFTASAHPVATAVGLENLRIIEERQLVKHAAEMSPFLLKGLRDHADHPLVGEVRGVGLMAAVELVADKKTKRQFDPAGKLGAYFFERGHHHGLIIRNVGDSICFCPPLIIQADQIKEMIRRFAATLDDAQAWAKENLPA